MKTNLRLVSTAILFGALVGGVSPAYAQEGSLLEEIVVTGQKREQNLRDVAATINVVSGDRIDELNILNFEDLERVTSGVQLLRPNPRNTAISIRGVYFDPESGTAASADIYQNGVTQRADNLFGALYDIERVEVLRGPQGSLQGATSPAGAIIINTQKPNLEQFEGYVRATGAEAGMNLQGAVSLPLIRDRLSLRIAAFEDENDAAGVTNLRTGNAQETDTTSFRASLRWLLTDSIELNLSHQNLDQTIIGTPQIVGTRGEAAAFAGVPGVPCNFIPGGLQDLCVSFNRNDRAAFAANDAFTTRDVDITTLNLDIGVGENHTLSYVFGNTESDKVSRTENDISSNLELQNFFFNVAFGVTNDTDLMTQQGTTTVVDAQTHEIRFASNDNPVWNYMVGAYFRDQETTTDFEAFTRLVPIPLPVLNGSVPGVTFTGGAIEGINFTTGGSIPVNGETEAFFTAHSFKLSERTPLEAALRYQEFTGFRTTDILFGAFNQPERISIQGATALGLPDAFATQIAGLVLQGTLGAIAATNIVGIPPEFQNLEQDATTGTLSIKHDFSDNLSAYFSYNRSYRNGGISVNPGETLPVQFQLYDEENADAFELGIRKVMFGGNAEVNATLYQQDFDGYQGFVRGLTYINTQGQVDPLTGGLVFNGDATIQGIEFDWRWAASENWLIGGTSSYSKAEFDNASIPCNIRAPGEILGFCQSSGRIPGSTEIQASLFSELSVPAGDNAEIYFRGNAKYTNGILSTRAVNFGEDPGRTPSYLLADLFIGYRNNNWDIAAFIKNALNEDADLDLRNPGDPNFDPNGDFTEVLLLPEQSVGLTVTYNF